MERMLTKMNEQYEKELTKFLFDYNNRKEYFIAWIPQNYNEIEEMDKSNFILCVEEGKIVGCLGTYISKDQKLARPLGPIIIEDYFNEYADKIYEEMLRNLPTYIEELRVAFFEDNKLCSNWYESSGYELYNAEKTMIYNKNLFIRQDKDLLVDLKPYDSMHKEGLSLVHPKETFFSLEELIDQISEYHTLLLAISENQVVGYVYYEKTKDKKKGELVLLHVRQDKRDKGYGSILLNRAIEDLISDDVKEISTSVRVKNLGAQRLYERVGFRDKETIYAYKKQL